MAFKSESQRRKFSELLKQGKITQKVFDGFDAVTDKEAKLPDRTTWAKGPKVKTVKILRAQKVSRK